MHANIQSWRRKCDARSKDFAMDQTDSQQIVLHPEQIAANEVSYQNTLYNEASEPSSSSSERVYPSWTVWLKNFKPASKPITLYERALLDCDEFDINLDDPKLNTFEAFFKFANESTGHVQLEDLTRKETYELAFKAYYSDQLKTRRQLVSVFLDMASNGTTRCVQYAANAVATSASTATMASAGSLLGEPSAFAGGVVGFISGLFFSKKFLSPLVENFFSMGGLVKELEESGYFEEIDFSNQSPEELDKEYAKALNRLNACRTTRNGLIKRIRKNYKQSLSLEHIKGDKDSVKRFLELEKAYRTVKVYRMLRNEWD